MSGSGDGETQLSLYKEALEMLENAGSECNKKSNVDIVATLDNLKSAENLINIIKEGEANELRKAGLSQLSTMLCGFTEILKKKAQELEGSDHRLQKTPDTKVSTDKESHSRQLAIQDTIVKKGQLTFDDVAGLSEAKQALTEAIVMPLQYPQLFTGGRKPWRRILLYGPPGTGKSRLAQAVSSQIDSSFYCVSSSDLVSSWVGESEKLIKELFHHGKCQQGRSVIFIDEIDSICRRRSAQEEEHTRRIKTELLKQMEGAGNDEQGEQIFLLCATNCPWEIDTAFLRRFQKRIYVPLPDREARLDLMKIHVKACSLSLSEADWMHLSDRTEGYSGSDISNMVLGALFEPVRELQGASLWKHTTGGKYIPCESAESGPNIVRAKIQDLPPDQVHARDLRLQDFIKSMSSHKNTVSKEELDKFQQFTKSFGECG